MAKDDYFVIAAKILVYLYKRLMGKEKLDDNYIAPMIKDFPISEEYLLRVIEMMSENEYIKEAVIVRAWGGGVAYYDLSNMCITEKGIKYLSTDSVIRKICEGIREAATIASLFIQIN